MDNSNANIINSVAAGEKVPCPKCNSLNLPEAVFCFSCGAKIEKPDTAPAASEEPKTEKNICPGCGDENEPGAVFCRSCGLRIGGFEEGEKTPLESPAFAPASEEEPETKKDETAVPFESAEPAKEAVPSSSADKPAFQAVQPNAAASVFCSNCGTENSSESGFCRSCGAKLETVSKPEEKAPSANKGTTSSAVTPRRPRNSARMKAYEAARQARSEKASQVLSKPQTPAEELQEEVSVFAEGLPSWDMVPPQIVVRRKGK